MKTPPKTKSAKSATKAPAKASKSKAPAQKAKAPARSAAKAKPKNKALAKAGPKKPAPKPKAAPAPKAAKKPAAAPDPSAALKTLAVAALEDLKGVDIKVLDVRELTPITDHMVICTGTSNRHVKSLAENVMDKAKEKGFKPIGIEGLAEGEWVLVDLNGVLVHVMQAQPRLFYQLEKLWDMSQAQT